MDKLCSHCLVCRVSDISRKCWYCEQAMCSSCTMIYDGDDNKTRCPSGFMLGWYPAGSPDGPDTTEQD